MEGSSNNHIPSESIVSVQYQIAWPLLRSSLVLIMVTQQQKLLELCQALITSSNFLRLEPAPGGSQPVDTEVSLADEDIPLCLILRSHSVSNTYCLCLFNTSNVSFDLISKKNSIFRLIRWVFITSVLIIKKRAFKHTVI